MDPFFNKGYNADQVLNMHIALVDPLCSESSARRLYVTHGTHVVVIDVESGKLVGKIDNTPGAHFTVIDPELDRGFISNGGAARLTIFNTKTLETIGQVKSTGENPGPTVFDPATKRIFTFNLKSHNA